MVRATEIENTKPAELSADGIDSGMMMQFKISGMTCTNCSTQMAY